MPMSSATLGVAFSARCEPDAGVDTCEPADPVLERAGAGVRALGDGWSRIGVAWFRPVEGDAGSDSEYGHRLQLEVRDAALVPGAAIGIGGDAYLDVFGESGGATQPRPEVTWSGDPEDGDTRNAVFYVVCFCDQRDGSQRVDGSLVIDRADEERVAGRIMLDVEGNIPASSLGEARARVIATFDVPRP